MPAPWLTVLSWTWIALAFGSGALIVADILVGGYRQHMWIMEVVWPVTALYFGPLALPAYRRWGRPMTHKAMAAQGGEMPEKPFWAQVAVGVSHCGAGCSLADLVAEWVVFATGLQLAGLALPMEYVWDYILALALGILFQYFSIAPMRGLSVGKGLRAAAKADFLSLTAFEVGLFGWMAIMQLVVFTSPHLTADHAAFWFLMQVGMVIGFLTAYPMNWWLIRRGVKEAM
ncbi:MAG TPA: DUF4396 domain-containing protein [Acidimicrobiales bacterium]|jgi:hypothetical protein|nr:DUF4396 domain-containing protein [Acidimicrobiales bacterium]